MGTLTGTYNIKGGNLVVQDEVCADEVLFNKLEVLDVTGSPVEDVPAPATHFRTGTGSYVNLAGSLSTAGDSTPRYGLPYVVRRNLLASSSSLKANAWSATRCTPLLNAAPDPYGGNSAVKLIEDTVNSTRYLQQLNIAVTPGQPYSHSWHLKAGERTWARIAITDSETVYTVSVNLSTGALGQIMSGITASSPVLVGGFWRVTVTRTVTGSSVNAVLIMVTSDGTGIPGYEGDGASGIYVYEPQLEPGSSSSAYQPTNATGVDLTNPINGAGLVLEGAGTNLLTANQSTGGDALGDTTGFASNAGAVLTRVTTEKYQGTGSIQVVTPGVAVAEGVQIGIVSSVFSPYAGQTRVKGAAGTRLQCWVRLQYGDATSTNGQAYNLTTDGTWQYCAPPVPSPTAGKTVSQVLIFVRTEIAVAATFYVDHSGLEAGPFQTSWIEGGTTRNADQCALSIPGNELAYSHDIPTGITASKWAKSAGCSVARDANGRNLVTLAATTDYLQQAYTTASGIASTARTIAVRLMLPSSSAISGSVRLRLLDQAGNQIAIKTINTTELSTTEARTFSVTGTAAADDTGVIAQLIGNSGTGGIIVEAIGMVPGSFPGIIVRTEDTPIIPSGAVVDPAWWQNGSIEFDVVPPPSQSATYNLIGAESQVSVARGILRVGRWATAQSNQLNFHRAHNGSTGSGGVVGHGSLLPIYPSFWDGAKHRIKLEWLNYTLAGVRYMHQRLYIDNMTTPLASQNVAALYGATAWIAPERLWLSDGSTFATLSNIKLGTPTLPSGAIPATV